MIKLTEKIAARKMAVCVTGKLSLPIDVRVRSRARVTLDDGREAGLFLPRGHLLRGGDILKSEEGLYIEIVAAPEMVSTAIAQDVFTLIKAAYHLGNRHVPLQIEQFYLRYHHDHILDDMLRQMGLVVYVSQKPFEPESGAYQQMTHAEHAGLHGNDHDHSHSHNH